MKPALLFIVFIFLLGSIVSGQLVVDGMDASSKHHNKDIRVSIETNDFGISTVIVTAPKGKIVERSTLSIVLRSVSTDKESYIYLPLLIEDGDDVDSWSARTGQNVTRTWMRGRHGIYFSTCKMPSNKLKELTLEVLIGNYMTNPTLQYSLKKISSEQDGANQPATAPESKLEGNSKPQTESEGRSQ